MSDPSPQPEPAAAPIDAEFEPVDTPAPDARLSVTPGWFAFCLLGLVSLTSLGLSFMGSSLFRTPIPPQLPVDSVRVQADMTALSTRLDRISERLETLSGQVETGLSARAAEDRNRAGLSTRLATLETALTRLETRLTDSSVSPEGGEPLLLLSRIEQIESAVSDLGSGQGAAASSAELAALEALQSELGVLRSELTDLRTGEADTQRRQAAALALMAVNTEAARGRPFLLGLQQLRAALPGDSRVAALTPYAPHGVPTLEHLQARFRVLQADAVATDAAAADIEPGWVDSLFGDSVRVRRTRATSLAQQLDRAGTALESGDIETALSELDQLPAAQRDLFAGFMQDARGRRTLDETLDSLRLMVMSRSQP